MKKFILSFFMLMAASSCLRADAVTFEATVNSPRISLDEVMQLTLTVHRGQSQFGSHQFAGDSMGFPQNIWAFNQCIHC